MARPNRYQIMDLYRDDIINEFNEINTDVLTLTQIERVLASNRLNWRLPNSTTLQQFLEYLILKKKLLKEVEFGTGSRREKRFLYLKRDINITSLGLSLYPNSYLCHYSAVMFHDLTDEIVKSTYVNHEQTKKTKTNNKLIPQKNIDIAFSKPMRSTNNYLDYNNQRIYIINSQYSNNLGVIERENIRVTDIERTLIDITVRPQYSGGVFEVLNIFKKARGDASVNRIIAYLKKLDFTYPYHQAIGFYLEKAGYKENAIKLIENKFTFENDFYLTYNMENKAYNERWRIYYPMNL
ncbi:hypothetical protein P9D43_20835 [Neobacillus niacini]|uniref:type IV toxin-antitoxin system AbiEi family antitoxin domain-containing protein n=1 Tax=Neobacillus niacini TaxID=86668 RepID=UPI0007AB2DB0|nr:hypothetical protein [Neobacillus niacini]MEC1524452.1 hypothetical protein [Neobacillus niacini]